MAKKEQEAAGAAEDNGDVVNTGAGRFVRTWRFGWCEYNASGQLLRTGVPQDEVDKARAKAD